MCGVLKIARSTYYYEQQQPADQSVLITAVLEIFRSSRNNYGARKIKKELQKKDIVASRRKIGQIMKQEGLVSSYTVAQFRPTKKTCNEAKNANVVDRQFKEQAYRNVVVSDLTYVRVGMQWNYICVLADLFNREIIGYSSGRHKTATLVKQAFCSIKSSLCEMNIFHTDRGNEFKNKFIDEMLKVFKIRRSLSRKGCPYDNVVAEATFKIVKMEFVKNRNFESLHHL